MKLALQLTAFSKIIGANVLPIEQNDTLINEVIYDTRKIIRTEGVVFFALQGTKQNGSAFIDEAHQKGIRYFVTTEIPKQDYPNATFLIVDEPLLALQKLAADRRQHLKYPLLVVTGAIGKTTVKEWIHHLLAPNLQVVRSPKSYNSQLGVALSLLELPSTADLAIIEAAATQPGEMAALYQMLQPNYGVITNTFLRGSNFKDTNEFRTEIQQLFSSCQWVIDANQLTSAHPNWVSLQAQIPFKDPASIQNAALALACALRFNACNEASVQSLPRLALRLETFDGKAGSTLINDAYTLDLISFEGSLAYLKSLAQAKDAMVCCYLKPDQAHKKSAIEALIQAYQIEQYFIWEKMPTELPSIENKVILIKGNDHLITEQLLDNWRLKKHSTTVSYDLAALQHNLLEYRKMLNPETKILVMVKAQAYGAGNGQWIQQLVQSGANYLGVAYADEGAELRKLGITHPILVMNAEPEAFQTCIEAELEPAIYSLEHLDAFIRKLISFGREAYPIHLKLDTGMHRLGFAEKEIPQLIETLIAQPEVAIKSIYSHMACADQPSNPFNLQQIARFEQMSKSIQETFAYPIFRHLLNSEGAAHFAAAQYDMVRLGIGLFGINHDPDFAKKLKPVLEWKSHISQIKTIAAGDCVGYGCTEKVEGELRIAIIPVGYADGFKRNLGEGKGGVFINGSFCPTIGRVCMDMIMVKISAQVQLNDEVEIIGRHQMLNVLANAAQTIPYEILTGIAPRVQRVYVNN
jgi:alanine racemase